MGNFNYDKKMKDYENIANLSVAFLRDYALNVGAKGFILGVSGGLDSAVVATLCAKAMPEHTHALLMPTNQSSPANLNDAVGLCEHLGLKFKILNIQPIIDAFAAQIGSNLSQLRLGNLAARVRMSLLYDHSAALGALVVGTSNKSELMLGYGTIFGDTACALNPIADLFKTEIFQLARHLKINENIISKAPSADLWQGQSDEDELGYSYALIDQILAELENGESEREISAKFGEKATSEILKRVKNNEFKRRMPLTLKFN